MRLQVKGKNLELSDSIRSYAEQKLGKLDKQLGDDGAGRGRARRREEPVDPREPGRRGDRVHEGPLRCACARRRRTCAPRSTGSRTSSCARSRSTAKSAAASPAAEGRARTRAVILSGRRREPLHERLAREGGLLAAGPGADTSPHRGTRPGIHGVHRPREWDEVATVDADVEGERARVRRAPDDEIVIEDGPDDVEPLAERVSLDPPYRAEAVRRRRRSLGRRRAADRGREARRARTGGARARIPGRGAGRSIVDGDRRLRLDPALERRGRLRRPRPAPGRRSLGDRGLATLGDDGFRDSALSRRFCASAKAGALKRIAEQAEYVLSLQPEFEKLSDAELRGKSGGVQAAARERRVPRGAALRGVRRDPRGVPPRPPASSSSRCR